MNKMDFVNELAQLTNMPKSKALAATNAMLDIFTRKLNEKEKIQFIGFGALKVRQTPERMARNPRINEPVMIPERYKAVFKPSKRLLSTLNGPELAE